VHLLDGQQVVRAAPGQVFGVGTLGVHRVGADDRPADRDAVQQRGEHGDLIRRRAHFGLAQDHPVAMVESRQQMTAVCAAVTGAA
jgi:hypothetical protein